MYNKHGSESNVLQKKFLRISEAVEVYSIGKTKLLEMAKEAKAVYKRGGIVIINVKEFDEYLESYKLL